MSRKSRLPLRASDATGRWLVRADSTTSVLVGNVNWRRLEFWGNVTEVRIDRVENWAELEIAYDLPPAPKLPENRQGLTPPLAARLRVVDRPGGRVEKTLKVNP